MMLGRCCHCGEQTVVRAITIKCFDKSNGTLIWEDGIGCLPTHHYAADRITWIKINNPVTFNTHIVTIGTPGVFPFGNRNTDSLAANAKASYNVVKMNSLTGAVIDDNPLPFLFSKTSGTLDSVADFGNLTEATSAAGLSGGNYLVAGHVPIQVEITDYTTNNATKTYVFHPHTHTAGFISLRTRVNNQLITWAFNSSAATVKAALEAVTDVTSATVTGGPWPFEPLNVSVIWANSTNDFKEGSFTETTVVGLSNRSTKSSFFIINPATGKIVSTAGYIFGDYSGAVKLINTTGFVPVGVDAVSRAFLPIAGPSNTVIVTGGGNQDWYEGWNTNPWSENFTVWNNHGGTTLQTKARIITDGSGSSSTGNVIVSGQRRTYSGGVTRVGCRIGINTGARTELDHTTSILNNNSCEVFEQDAVAGTYFYSNFNRQLNQRDIAGSIKINSNLAEIDASGTLLRLGCGKVFGMDSTHIYAHNFGGPVPNLNSALYYFPFTTPAMIAGTDARDYYWTFYWPVEGHLTTGTEFRFRFFSSAALPIYFSSWIDWNASVATISTALNSVFPPNTQGVRNNVIVCPFGAPAALANTTSLLERGLDISFAGAANATGVAANYIPAGYVRRPAITIETRNHTAEFSPAGIASFNRTTGALNWSRAFGTRSGVTIPFGINSWLRGSYVYSVATYVDNELP